MSLKRGKAAAAILNARPTYRATYEQSGEVIYADRARGNLIGELPCGAFPVRDDPGTLTRSDGGDPYERALFVTPSGRVIVVEREIDPLVRLTTAQTYALRRSIDAGNAWCTYRDAGIVRTVTVEALARLGLVEIGDHVYRITALGQRALGATR